MFYKYRKVIANCNTIQIFCKQDAILYVNFPILCFAAMFLRISRFFWLVGQETDRESR